MMTCPNCSRPCSDLAESCPNCGHPLRRRSLLTKNLGFGGAVYAVVLVAGILILGTSDSYRGLGVLLTVSGGLLILARLATAK